MPNKPKSIDIEIAHDNRLFVCGKTGSGKSTLVRRLLRQLHRVIVLDSKEDLDRWGLEKATEDTWRRLEKGEPARIRVTRPQGASSEEFWSETLERAYELGNVTIYADEASQLQRTTTPSDIIEDIWQRGRAFGVGGWAASQRPRRLPQLLISEAEHIFVFRLVLEADRKYMAGIVGTQVSDPIPADDPHGFWYFSVDRDAPIYVRSLPRQVESGDPIQLEVLSDGSSAG